MVNAKPPETPPFDLQRPIPGSSHVHQLPAGRSPGSTPRGKRSPLNNHHASRHHRHIFFAGAFIAMLYSPVFTSLIDSALRIGGGGTSARRTLFSISEILSRTRANTHITVAAATPRTSQSSWSFPNVPGVTDPTRYLKSGKFCVPWSVSLDGWHAHVPEWENIFNYDDGQCFQRVENKRTRYLRKVHDMQWEHGNCSQVHTHRMISSGWRADINWVAAALKSTYEAGRPFNVGFENGEAPWWHYAAIKQTGQNATCPTRDIFCYFYPLTRCKSSNVTTELGEDNIEDRYGEPHVSWLMDYVSRPQQWLRKAIYEYMRDEAPAVTTPCVAMHVRRADVVLHGSWSRRYFPLSAYLDKIRQDAPDLLGRKNNGNILLFTDDMNAIEEAHEHHPQHNWIYLNRTRHRGSSGGWENQVPSNDPKTEVIILLSVLELAKKCDAFAFTSSGYGKVILKAMLSTGRSIKQLKVDEGMEVFNQSHSDSEQQLPHLLLKQKR